MEDIPYSSLWLDGRNTDEDLSQAFSVRIRVFCDEQGYSPEMELDDLDREAYHLILLENNLPIATGRIYWKEPGVMVLGRIAVVKQWRKKGIGSILVKEMSDKAQALGAGRLQLDAQCRVVPFYEQLGFLVCGKEHMDGHVPHVMMQKVL